MLRNQDELRIDGDASSCRFYSPQDIVRRLHTKPHELVTARAISLRERFEAVRIVRHFLESRQRGSLMPPELDIRGTNAALIGAFKSGEIADLSSWTRNVFVAGPPASRRSDFAQDAPVSGLYQCRLYPPNSRVGSICSHIEENAGFRGCQRCFQPRPRVAEASPDEEGPCSVGPPTCACPSTTLVS